MKAFFTVFAVVAFFILSTTVSAETTGVQGSSARPMASPSDVTGDLTTETVSGLVGELFILDGTKSQDDGVVRTYLWRQISGPTIPLSSSSEIKLAFTPTVAGTYVFDLMVTDSVGLSRAVQRSTFVVQHNQTDFEFIKKSAEPIGDPDFDLLRANQLPATSIGDVDRDGEVDKMAPTVSNEGRDRAATSTIGDPDFDLLTISLEGDDLEKFREDVSSNDEVKKVTVRGWDPKKKEEILSRPSDVKTSEDLKMYLEAVVLNDSAIKGVKIEKGVIEVESREAGKLFWLIPVEMSSVVIVKFTVRDSEDRVSVRLPWWHVFVKKNYAHGPSGIQTEITAGLEEAGWHKVDNSETPVVSSVASALRSVSNVMKTKHDTVKNSISNVR